MQERDATLVHPGRALPAVGHFSKRESTTVTSMMLSAIVLGGFVAAAVVFLLLARLNSRLPESEVWFAALAQAVLSAMLLRVIYEGGILLNRTPALVYAGFTALAVVWGILRRETAILGPPAPVTITVRTTAWLAAVPASGVLVSLVALLGDWEFAPEIVGLVQMFIFTAAWFSTRGTASRAPASSRQIPVRGLKVFLSYRRDDSADVTGRLYDRLIEHFGAPQVFKDVDSIPPGVDFRAYLADQIGACNVMLAVIGARWLTPDANGRRRIDDPKDFVRAELEAAFEHDVPVVPVLVSGAGIPHAEQLPETLAALAYRQAQVVRPDPDFHRDVDRLLQGLDRLASIAQDGSSGAA
ncbi:MAG: toll/interleukin-1 receptor domain-containing protein [Sedimenticolaceae bacterium]